MVAILDFKMSAILNLILLIARKPNMRERQTPGYMRFLGPNNPMIYGCEAWTLTETMERSLNVAYTRMLRKALNVHWSSHTPNEVLYGDLPRVSDKIGSRRLQLAGHCFRHPELSSQPLVLWEPKHGNRGRGRPRATYVERLKRDTGASDTAELATMMKNRKVWRSMVNGRLSNRPK